MWQVFCLDLSRHFFGVFKTIMRNLKISVELRLQDVPKVLLLPLLYKSVLQSRIKLVKQIIETEVVSFNLIYYFHTCCAIF